MDLVVVDGNKPENDFIKCFYALKTCHDGLVGYDAALTRLRSRVRFSVVAIDNDNTSLQYFFKVEKVSR